MFFIKIAVQITDVFGKYFVLIFGKIEIQIAELDMYFVAAAAFKNFALFCFFNYMYHRFCRDFGVFV